MKMVRKLLVFCTLLCGFALAFAGIAHAGSLGVGVKGFGGFAGGSTDIDEM